MKRYIKKVKKKRIPIAAQERMIKAAVNQQKKFDNIFTGIEMILDVLSSSYKDKIYKFRGTKEDAELFILKENDILSVNKIKNPGA